MARIGVMLPRDLPAGRVLAFAREAERLGFDELWVVEDLGFRGGVAQAGAVLAATSRIVVGIGILPAGARNAAFAAMELATLAQLFPGRLIAGIGHGMRDWMRQVGVRPASPLTLLREYTVAVRALIRGEPGPAAGRYVDVEGVVLAETPHVVPPVVLGVRGPKSIAVAGRFAEGVLLAEPSAPPYVAAALERLASPSPEVITYDAAVIGDDGPAARDRVRPGLAWIGEPDWAPHLAALPFAADLARHRAAAADRDAFAATMPDAWVRELSLAGTPDEVRARIAARHAAGATSVVLIPAEPDALDALPRLARALPGA
ncbi:LLM class flavin-dependent oxidoreductase [Dactylosporangium sp. CA-139066]|uniref:LLM class flavin-dependent oxidoreductase n=1 Tax=Dactylosporangium sp. CA-139066 TaxID=3239930 RepID=UPI003D93F67C